MMQRSKIWLAYHFKQMQHGNAFQASSPKKLCRPRAGIFYEAAQTSLPTTDEHKSDLAIDFENARAVLLAVPLRGSLRAMLEPQDRSSASYPGAPS